MRTFIQLRNGVGYATLITPEAEPDHTVTPDHTTAIEVFTDNPDQFLKMKYNAETKTWSEAPLIIYGVIDNFGRVIEIRRTVFPHEAEGLPIITESLLSELRPDWTWDGEKWNVPNIVEAEVVSNELSAATDPLAIGNSQV
jgi:hypothetical protein